MAFNLTLNTSMSLVHMSTCPHYYFLKSETYVCFKADFTIYQAAALVCTDSALFTYQASPTTKLLL